MAAENRAGSGAKLCALKAVRAPGLEFVTFDGKGSLRILGADESAHGDELQRQCVVELRRPSDGDLDAFAFRQWRFRGKQHAAAAHVQGLAETGLLDGLLAAENFISDIPLYG